MTILIYFLFFATIFFLALSTFLIFKIFKQSRQIQDFKKQTANHQQITQSLLTTFDLNKLLTMILENLSKGLELDNAYIYTLEGSESTGMLSCIATSGAISLKGIDRLSIGFLEEEEIVLEAFRSRQPILVPDVDKDGRCSPALVKMLKLEQMMFQTLYAHGKTLGLVIAGNTHKGGKLDAEKLNRFSLIVSQAGIALENAQFYEKIHELSITDELTGIYNYRYFYPKLREETRLSSRYRQPLSVVIADIDDFKKYNDLNGHLAGDLVLKQIAQIFASRLRKTDTVVRYGGEEFALILPVTSREGAKKIIEDLLKEIRNYPFQFKENLPEKKITVSAGISTYPYDAREAQQLVEFADKGLYLAKSRGKNQVALLSENDYSDEKKNDTSDKSLSL